MEAKQKPDIYGYTDYRAFLKDYFEYKKSVLRGYSYRCHAIRAGITSHSLLPEVIAGKRNLTKKTMAAIIKPFELGSARNEYFVNMVMFNQAQSEEEQSRYFGNMVRLQKQPRSKTLSAAQYKYYDAWFNSIVRAAVTLKDFKEDPSWIASRIDPSVTPGQANKALKLLQELGLLKRNEQGTLVQESPRLEVDPDVSTLAIRNFNRSMIDRGKEAIERVEPADREVSGMTIGISEDGYKQLKNMVRKFKDEVADFVNREAGEIDRVFQMNLQLFPVTKKDQG